MAESPECLTGMHNRFRPRRGRLALVLISDPRRLPDPGPAAARLPAGAAVIARGLMPAVLQRLAAIVRRCRLQLLISGDGRLALRFAAGLHLPDRRATTGLLPFLLARRRRPQFLPLTVAAHGWAGLARARSLNAAACILSPVFPTLSHPGVPALGPLRWAALAARAGRCPVVALGGMNRANAARLPPRAAGIAAIGGLSERPHKP